MQLKFHFSLNEGQSHLMGHGKTLTLGIFVAVYPIVAAGQTACSRVSNCSTSTYNITGKTAAELATSMDQLGPGEGWAQTRVNFTDADKYTTSTNSNGAIEIDTVTINPAITITMPNWPGYGNAKSCLKDSWNAMYASLLAHEKKHVSLAQTASRNAEKAAKSTPAQADEDALKVAAAERILPIIKKLNADQDAFDKSTSHGKTDPSNPVVLKECPT